MNKVRSDLQAPLYGVYDRRGNIQHLGRLKDICEPLGYAKSSIEGRIYGTTKTDKDDFIIYRFYPVFRIYDAKKPGTEPLYTSFYVKDIEGWLGCTRSVLTHHISSGSKIKVKAKYKVICSYVSPYGKEYEWLGESKFKELGEY